MKTNTGIQDELKNMGSATLAGMPQSMPHTVPPAYFEEFGIALIAGIKEQDIKLSFEAAKQMPYSAVPVNYFDHLPETILNIALAKKQTKPEPSKRLITLRPLKWAAAAAIIIGLSIGSYRIFSGPQTTGTEQMLSAVPNSELHEYLQNSYRIDVDRVVNNNTLVNMQLDNKDIIKYLDETGWDIVD